MLHIVSSLSRKAGGVAPVVWELAKYQQRCGVKVQIASLRDEFTDRDAQIFPDLPYFAGKIDWFQTFGFSRELKKFCLNQKIKFDLVHSHGLWMYPGMLAGEISRKREIPLIVTPHGMLEPWAFKNNLFKKMPLWWIYQKKDLKTAQLLHVTSRQEAKSLRNLQLNNPLAIIPNGVELPVEGDTLKRYCPSKIILFLSRIHKVKGLVNFVKAWSYVQTKGWRIIIAGPDDGGHQVEVEHEIRRNGLEGIFEFVGPVYGRDKWELYQNSSVFVLPTHSENFGIVVAEALASGIPVITTKGAPWEELQTHKCGWWVDIGVEPLVTALQEATSLNSEELKTMGQRGKKLIETKYSWESLGENMLLAYEWVLHGGNPQKFIEVS